MFYNLRHVNKNIFIRVLLYCNMCGKYVSLNIFSNVHVRCIFLKYWIFNTFTEYFWRVFVLFYYFWIYYFLSPKPPSVYFCAQLIYVMHVSCQLTCLQREYYLKEATSGEERKSPQFVKTIWTENFNCHSIECRFVCISCITHTQLHLIFGMNVR